MIENGFTVLLLCGLAWFWWDGRGAAERAIKAAQQSCERAGLVFLNDTVGWKKLRLKRNKRGRMQFQRTYFFEFSSDMERRSQGEVVMLGQHVTDINLDAYRVS